MMTSRIRGLIVLVGIMSIVVGCSLGSSGNGISDVIVDPIKVTLTLDESSAASATIGRQGGTVSTTAQDGTTYTLVIPPGALINEEEISLTPVIGMDGLPLTGGLVGAVDFAPDGLELYAAAILTIQVTGAIESGEFETVGLAYSGDGEELHLFPMSVEGDTITMEIYHFSGYGGGQGSADEVEDMANNRAPSDPEAQMNNEMAGTSDQEKAIDTLNDSWTEVVEPALNAAINNENLLAAALRTFNNWLDWILLYDLTAAFSAQPNLILQGYSMLAEGVENAGIKSHKRCLDNNDPAEILNIFHWLAFAEREPEIMNTGFFSLDELIDLARKCATFELEFVSEIRADPGAAEMYSSVSTEKIKLEPIFIWAEPGVPASSLISFENIEGKLTYNDQYHPGEPFLCTGSSITLLDSTFTIKVLAFDVAAPANSGEIEFRYDPGIPDEKWSMAACIGNDPPTVFLMGQWIGFFCLLRAFIEELEESSWDCESETPSNIHAFVSGDWDGSGTGKIFAEKLYIRDVQGVISEVTRITIYHTPQP